MPYLAQNSPQQGCFARAVYADESCQLPTVHFKRDVLQQDVAPLLHADLLICTLQSPQPFSIAIFYRLHDRFRILPHDALISGQAVLPLSHRV